MKCSECGSEMKLHGVQLNPGKNQAFDMVSCTNTECSKWMFTYSTNQRAMTSDEIESQADYYRRIGRGS